MGTESKHILKLLRNEKGRKSDRSHSLLISLCLLLLVGNVFRLLLHVPEGGVITIKFATIGFHISFTGTCQLGLPFALALLALFQAFLLVGFIVVGEVVTVSVILVQAPDGGSVESGGGNDIGAESLTRSSDGGDERHVE